MRLVLPFIHEVGFRPTSKHRRRSVSVRAYVSFEVPEVSAGETDEVVSPGDWELLDGVHRNDAPSAAVRFGYRDRVFKPVRLAGAWASPQTYQAAFGTGDLSGRRLEQLARGGWWTPAVAHEMAPFADRFPLAYPTSASVSELHGAGVVTDEGDKHERWSEAAQKFQQNIVVIDGFVHVACYDPVWTLRKGRRLAILLDPTDHRQHRYFRLDRLDAAMSFSNSAPSPNGSVRRSSGSSSPSSPYLRRDDVVAVAVALLPLLPAVRHAIASLDVESDVADHCFRVVTEFIVKKRTDRNEAQDLLESIAATFSKRTPYSRKIISPAAYRELTNSVARWCFEREYLDEVDRNALIGAW